jgi:hypothetical protein
MKLYEISYDRIPSAVTEFFSSLENDDWKKLGYDTAELLDIGYEADLSEKIEPYKIFIIKNMLIDLRSDRHFRLRAVLAVLRNFNVNWPDMSVIEKASFDLLPNQR